MVIRLLHNMKVGEIGMENVILLKGTVLDSSKEPFNANIVAELKAHPERFDIISADEPEDVVDTEAADDGAPVVDGAPKTPARRRS